MLPTLFYATYPRGVKGTSSSGNTDRSDQNIHVRGHSAVCKLRNEDFITSSNIILASLFFSPINYSLVQFSLWKITSFCSEENDGIECSAPE
jgi:hypothetical protein